MNLKPFFNYLYSSFIDIKNHDVVSLPAYVFFIPAIVAIIYMTFVCIKPPKRKSNRTL